ncbi:putative Class III aminotransferase [Pleurostoma richardsiae]|uniref:Class III aminotransferase n=1 Tax=Pleurostoma richardsiae TaxID=41990 RepID=A0AA38VSX5_9PEZI|nr:putative Class III aminotransferase [Pleurostoma richardsiae]
MELDKFFQDSHIFHRSFERKPVRVVSQSGLTLTLEDGRTVIDATGGPAVACLGHNVPEVAEAVSAQLQKVGYLFSGGGYREDTTEQLAAHILKGHPGGLTKAIFLGSGSEATDAVLKLTTQYWAARGQPQRTNYIARKQSYHGNTLGALCVSGHEGRRKIYRHWLSPNVSFVDACYGYRGKLDGECDEKYVLRLADQLEAEIQRLGPDTVAAFVAETVSGSTLACVPAVKGYFRAVRDICDKYDILLVLDEVMCGMSRTGTLHAWQQEGIRGPDIQMIGKSLGGGFIPLSGVLVHQKIFDAIATPSGALAGGHTFQTHPTACAAALAVQCIISRNNLLANVRRMGILLETLLRDQLGSHPLVGDIRGRGLFWAVEFMLDPTTLTPFPPDDDFSGRVVEEALENHGLQVLRNMGFPGTWKVDSVVVCPPFIVTEEAIREIVSRLKAATDAVAAPYLETKGAVAVNGNAKLVNGNGTVNGNQKCIEDYLPHYFACIEICDREKFFAAENPAWELQREAQRRRLEDETESPSDFEFAVNEKVRQSKADLAAAIESRYGRIEVLRQVIGEDEKARDYVTSVVKSYSRWRASEEYSTGITAVRNWRKDNGKFTDDATAPEAARAVTGTRGRSQMNAEEKDRRAKHYDVEKDVQAYVVEYGHYGPNGKETRKSSQQPTFGGMVKVGTGNKQ